MLLEDIPMLPNFDLFNIFTTTQSTAHHHRRDFNEKKTVFAPRGSETQISQTISSLSLFGSLLSSVLTLDVKLQFTLQRDDTMDTCV